MNHPLAIYTALFFAIIFMTVSVWSGDIKDASGEELAMLILLGTFSLKLAIDDYVHFHSNFGDKNRLHISLWFSLITYLLLAASIAAAATNHLVASKLLFMSMMLIGVAWIYVSETASESAEAKKRHRFWKFINWTFVVALLIDILYFPEGDHDPSIYLIYALTGLVVVDAVVSRTIRRLAELS